tara:strand:+ start:152 stop:523 length:372 start_codon:yes stop_codon:yes gene_type:complete
MSEIDSAYRGVRVTIWNDGVRDWILPKPGRKLSPSKRSGHAALRRHVMIRDNFTCQSCGLFGAEYDESYTGKWAAYCGEGIDCKPLHIDHISPRCCSGSNHPDNLQALCVSCNSRKAGTHGES